MRLIVSICTLAVALQLPATSFAQSFADRMPEHTSAMIRIRNTSEFGDHLNMTALAMALQDEQVAPLAERMMGALGPAMEDFRERTGMGPGDFLKMAPGELVLGLVCLPAYRPAVVLMFQADESSDELEASEAILVDNGFERSKTTLDGVEVKVLRRSSGPVNEIFQMQLGQWRCVTTMEAVAARLIALHRGDTDETALSSVQSFQTIMTQAASKSIEAHVQWYFDPIKTVRSFLRGNFTAAAGLAMLPALGVDGIKAVGGSLVAADEQFDIVTRTHLLIESPRKGVTEALALRGGSVQPERWVPAEASLYSTLHLDPLVMFESLAEVVDGFRSQGSFGRWVKSRFSEPLGIDFETELMPAMTGRYTLAQLFEEPVSFNSQRTVFAFELMDPVAFADTLIKLREKWGDRIEVEPFAGVDLYKITSEREAFDRDGEQDDLGGNDDDARRRRRNRRRRRRREMWLQAEPVFAIVGQSLVMADRIKIMEKLIMTQDGAEDRLRDELDYKLVASKLTRQSATTPSMIRFERPTRGLEALYSLLFDEEVREAIRENRDDNPLLAELELAIEEDRIPPFEILSKYFAPTGSMIFNEETGFHHVGFGLRRELEDDSSF